MKPECKKSHGENNELSLDQSDPLDCLCAFILTAALSFLPQFRTLSGTKTSSDPIIGDVSMSRGQKTRPAAGRKQIRCQQVRLAVNMFSGSQHEAVTSPEVT